MEQVDLYKRFSVPAPVPFSSSLPVLVAEAHNELRLIIAHQLEKQGFTKVTKLRDGRDAILEARRTPFGVVLVGDDLPSVGGLDFLKEMREDSAITRGAFVLITRALNKPEVMLAVESGINDLMVRPVIPADIMPKIRSAYQNFVNPRNPERIYEFAKVKLREKKFDEAQVIYEALVSSNPEVARPHVGLARVHMSLANMDAAKKNCDEAISRNGNYVHAFVTRAEILLALGDSASAIEDLKKAVDLSPLNVTRLEKCCEVLLGQKMHGACIEILSKSLAAGLVHPFITERMGYCHFLQQQYTEALEYLKEAVKLEPENVSFLNSLAICYRDAKDFDSSIGAYNQILKKEPENWQVLFNKALVLIQKNAPAEAAKILKRVLNINPEATRAKEKLVEVERLLEKDGGKPPAAS